MGETEPQPNLGRSILAVVAGVIVGVALSLATDEVLHKAGVYPPWGAPMTGYEGTLGLATAYRAVYSILASYVIARLAPRRPMKHAMIGGWIGLAASIAGAVATWNGGPAFGPHWYPVALVVIALPTAWVGGRLRVRQLGGQAA